jgi:hypothetical protein
MAAAATVLDRCEAARRRKLPFFGSNAKLREIDRRQTLERVAAQRAALSAARVGLPQVRGTGQRQRTQGGCWVSDRQQAPGAVAAPTRRAPTASPPPPPPAAAPRRRPPQVILSSKIAPRALAGVNSPDPLCARHALALAALVARDAPALFIDHVAPFIQGNLDIFQATGAAAGGRGSWGGGSRITSAGQGVVAGSCSTSMQSVVTRHASNPVRPLSLYHRRRRRPRQAP